MKMPEGWKRIHQLESTKGDDGVFRVTIGDQACICAFMRDMAEALEHEIGMGSCAESSKEVLNKFKEWK